MLSNFWFVFQLLVYFRFVIHLSFSWCRFLSNFSKVDVESSRIVSNCCRNYLVFLSNCPIVVEILSYCWLLPDLFLNYTRILLELMSICVQLLSKLSLNVDQFSNRSRVDVEMCWTIIETISNCCPFFEMFSKFCPIAVGLSIYSRFSIELFWVDVEIPSKCCPVVEFLLVTSWCVQIISTFH